MVLYNNDTTDTHMWITGESIGPNNKVRRLESRKADFLLEKNTLDNYLGEHPQTLDEIVKVYVGRNGVTLGSKPYTVNNKVPSLFAEWTGTYIK